MTTTQPATRTNPRMLPGENSAAYAHRMGYRPGTMLIGNEGYGDTILTLRYIGDRTLLADAIYSSGSKSVEGRWDLSYRDWKELGTEAWLPQGDKQ